MPESGYHRLLSNPRYLGFYFFWIQNLGGSISWVPGFWAGNQLGLLHFSIAWDFRYNPLECSARSARRKVTGGVSFPGIPDFGTEIHSIAREVAKQPVVYLRQIQLFAKIQQHFQDNCRSRSRYVILSIFLSSTSLFSIPPFSQPDPGAPDIAILQGGGQTCSVQFTDLNWTGDMLDWTAYTDVRRNIPSSVQFDFGHSTPRRIFLVRFSSNREHSMFSLLSSTPKGLFSVQFSSDWDYSLVSFLSSPTKNMMPIQFSSDW